ncbi:acetylcholine receptor subunit delta-like [Mercenaria mercenaria]|uniref:acetylcholine receptor subunit delta-like n=1 Tax=Mercenaria mercenaria TaxID=6596 RepID=UPI00234F212B|nr:acetylcholine receptor subunit delta-like [Mercenaria mercenaria]
MLCYVRKSRIIMQNQHRERPYTKSKLILISILQLKLDLVSFVVQSVTRKKDERDKFMSLTLLLLLPTLTAGVTLVTSNATDTHRLYLELFVKQGYNSKIQPIFTDQITEVLISLHLKSLNDLDEMSGTLQTSAYMAIGWFDVFLTWNESEYNGLSFTYWPQLFETSCEVEMTYFPFDIHTCELQFTPWSYTSVRKYLFRNSLKYLKILLHELNISCDRINIYLTYSF